MVDFCASHDIVADVEVIQIRKINVAYERMLRRDVRYRFVYRFSIARARDNGRPVHLLANGLVKSHEDQNQC